MLDSTSPKKAFKDIFLPEHLQLESLLAELDDFRTEKTREEYQVRGIPYQKHILFSGPAGTGKSSTILALASHYNLIFIPFHILEPLMWKI